MLKKSHVNLNARLAQVHRFGEEPCLIAGHITDDFTSVSERNAQLIVGSDVGYTALVAVVEPADDRGWWL